jgi:hypothetical protein
MDPEAESKAKAAEEAARLEKANAKATKEQAKAAAKSERHDDRAEKAKHRANTYKGIEVMDDRIVSRQGSGPIAGASARVETAGQISSRISASRVAILGPFALLARKKVDQRELYLTVEGTGFSIVEKLDPKYDGEAARRFAARINAAASANSVRVQQVAPSQPPAPPIASPPVSAALPLRPPSVADELMKLAELRNNGILTVDEFEAEKAKLLATWPGTAAASVTCPDLTPGSPQGCTHPATSVDTARWSLRQSCTGRPRSRSEGR